MQCVLRFRRGLLTPCSYVPIKIDYSDIYDVMAFFVGTPDGQGGHDSIAERMAEAGRVWAGEYWRKADMA